MPDSENDSLFDYDVDENDLRGLADTSHDAADSNSRGKGSGNAATQKDDLGLDENLVVRTRKPTVKLDHHMLLGPNGISKIKKEAPAKLKFKGKGYEYRDAARLLAYYRYWADDLFKKGRFRDTCAIIEKLGHTRAVKLQREAWISEAAYGQMNPGEMDRETEDDIRRQHERPVRESGNGQTGQEEDNDDDLYSVPNRTNVPSAAGNGAGTTSAAPQKQWQQDDPNSLFKGGFPDSDDDLMMDDDDDFDLDALLAEQRSNGKLVAATTNNTMAPVPVATSKPLPKTGSHNGPPPPDEYDGPPPPDEEDDFEAEMEALRDLGPPDE